MMVEYSGTYWKFAKEAPIIKILGSPKDSREKAYFDIYVGTILEGREPIAQADGRLVDEIIAVASGQPTKTDMMYGPYRVVMEMYATGPTL